MPGVGSAGRSPIHTSSLLASLVDGSFEAPKAGDKVARQDGNSVEWRPVKAGEDGRINERGIAYVFWTVESATDRVAILNARGYATVYVNGEPRGGDVYDYGYVQLPVKLNKGTNHFLFNVGRGGLRAKIEPVKANQPVVVVSGDVTLPDIVAGAQGEYVGALRLANASTSPRMVTVGTLRPQYVLGGEYLIPALSVRKVPFVISAGLHEPGELRVELAFSSRIGRDPGTSAGQAELTLRVVGARENRKVTFISAIDGSVQYYSVVPARPLPDAVDKPGIVLSLHGASVEATSQAGSYSPKSWCHIVCPTNRRPFGFDWEDWGRMDAMEVLDHAQATLDNDPTKVWLTGHSMGGHGTWTVGSHFPDRFAAIAPSAGWESFWSYGGGASFDDESAISEILTRSANPCRTLLRKHNYKQQAVYILHGDADDNVPVTEARRMRDTLKEFHTDLQYFEQPGAGHWWDAGNDHGADCVDWQPIFDTFARRRLPRAHEVQEVDFTTVNPGHSADCHWARIEMQQVQLAPSRIQLKLRPSRGLIEGITDNVSRMSLQLSGVLAERETLTVKLDGGEISVRWPASGRVHLRRSAEGWALIEAPGAALKGPQRYGWFKDAFKNHSVYVYGTQGSASETAANFAKARYDQEQWWYRANGDFEVLADTNFKPEDYKDRNVILIGNADNNSAWDKLLKDCPLDVRNGRVRIGERSIEGDDLSMLFTFPRADSDTASVAVIGGTGERGIRLTYRMSYFVSGASYPDFMVFGPEMLKTGLGGVRAAGYLGEDWSIKTGDIAWR